MSLPTAHLDKLIAAINNEKMPQAAKESIETALDVYHKWIGDMQSATGDSLEDLVAKLVSLFNEYKYFIDFELIYSSEEDFLYRQKGQLKLDNSIIEEFLPHLASRVFPELAGVTFGPTKCFSAAYFKTSLQSLSNGGGSFFSN